ncbi:MAG: EfeM/EfeO family lipoprotein [Microbacteriaceae bacterium]|nr:EfeM/EfeO family lipoprotein [Microbacteriaceae bacterium]MCL2794964.1 EfeM/EfeO family lipoprotein [Microbacteriaceae bacterium]
MPHAARFPWGWAVAAVGLIVCAVLAGTLLQPGEGGSRGAGAGASAAASPTEIALDVSHCGSTWGAHGGTHAAGGAQSFTFVNGNTGDVEVQLQQVASKKVFLEVDGVGAGARHSAAVALGAGDYRFLCYPADADPVVGPTVTVGKAPAGAVLTAGVVPLTTNDLIPVAKKYGAWVKGRLPGLIAQLRTLDADVAAGDLARARRDWLTAHLTYETLGAAYGAFGAYDTAIDGEPASGRTALDDPSLTGFHRVEALLWAGRPASDIRPLTRKLVTDATALAASTTLDRIDPLQIGLRAHEIVENAIQFELTGQTDAGSHTNLATIDANLAGSQQALSELTALLDSRYAQLPQTERSLAAARALVETYRRADGSWVPLDSLARVQREQLNAALDATVELLAPVAEISEPRKAVQQ